MGMRGNKELSWKGEVAKVAFVGAILLGCYSLVTLPRDWQEWWEWMQDFVDEDDEILLAFEALDADGDGYISRDDVRAFVHQMGLFGNAWDADEFFRSLDVAES